jgi:L-alanine-DL-glutamate epimerase-like enolase superfamily enzyme
LWVLFETRLREQQMPILITMNTRTKRDFIRLFSGKAADSRQIGLSIYNRLRQACQFIDFDVETQPADPTVVGEESAHSVGGAAKSFTPSESHERTEGHHACRGSD